MSKSERSTEHGRSWLIGSSRRYIAQALTLPVLTMILLAACSPPAQKPAPADVLAKGGEVYDMMCAQCHLDGSGSETAPPLIGSAAVAGDPSAVIAIILNGRKGQSLVGGKPFNGIMPAQGTMPDADIAAVTAYIRKQFANRDEDIPVPLVTSLRPAQSH